jgi:hypothetical protein
MTTTKKKTKKKNQKNKEVKLRKNIRTASLYPANAPKVRKELLDYDPKFLRQLEKNDPKAYEFLAAFTHEYVDAAIAKTKAGKVKAGYLHNTPELAKDRYDANNRRNNDVLGVTKSNHMLTNIDSELKNNDGFYITNPQLTEDAAINKMDRENEEELLSYEEYMELRHTMTEEMVLFYEAYYEET